MRIDAISLKSSNESTLLSNEASHNGASFSGLLSYISTTEPNSTDSVRNKLQKNIVMDQHLKSIDGLDQLLELTSESFDAFVNLLTNTDDSLLETGQNVDQSELSEAIQLLVNHSDGNANPDLELQINELLASVPLEVSSNIQQILQTFRQDGDSSNITNELSKPEITISLLILVARSLDDSKNLVQDPSLLKLLEFMKKELDTVNLSEVIPIKEEYPKALKKLVELLDTVFDKVKQGNGKITESESNRGYLQSVFSRYFIEPNGLRSSLNQNQSTFGQAVITAQGETQTSVRSEISTPVIIGTPDLQVPMSKVQQFALFVEHHSKQSINQEQFIKEFQNILARSQFGSGKEGMKLLIKLYPEHLGSLRIELLQKDNMLIARIIASSGAAKDVLESQVQSLKQSFLSQNIQIEKIEISQQLQQSERFIQKDSQQNNGQENRQMNEKNQQEESDTNESFETALQEELNVKV